MFRNSKELSVREKQFLGGLCVAIYCKHLLIRSKPIQEYVNHLLSILVCKDILEWERKGASLELMGRGEPIPPEVKSLFRQSDVPDFVLLIEYSSEIGIVDLFGASTEYPDVFLQKCIEIIGKHALELPGIHFKGLAIGADDVYGCEYSQEDFDNLLDELGQIIG